MIPSSIQSLGFSVLGFLLNAAKIVRQVLLKSLLDEPDWHAGLSLHQQVIKHPTAGGICSHPPFPLKSAEIPLDHAIGEPARFGFFCEFQSHPGGELQPAKQLGTHLLHPNPAIPTPEHS